mmetsp:Transcript_10343/g.43086  ORF Transcript_10343/g.43086 Transcript_10343/m.43086 type:complete len:95 (-) Transcript_10343:615-899(-)
MSVTALCPSSIEQTFAINPVGVKSRPVFSELSACLLIQQLVVPCLQDPALKISPVFHFDTPRGAVNEVRGPSGMLQTLDPLSALRVSRHVKRRL